MTAAAAELLRTIEQLNWPADDFIVVGGSVLAALGLSIPRPDIDLAVTPQRFQALRQAGWTAYEFDGRSLLRHNVFDVGVGFGAWSMAHLAADALSINGIRLMNPAKLLAWKYQHHRPKDVPHIALLEAYLQAHQG